MTSPDILIFEYLEANREAFIESQSEIIKKKNNLCSTESVLFHPDIKDQYFAAIRSNITNEICSRLALDYETVQGVIEDLDLDNYLNEYLLS